MAKITITVFREDLIIEEQKHPINDIDIRSIRSDRVSIDLIEDADLIIFEDGMNAKYLKKRM